MLDQDFKKLLEQALERDKEEILGIISNYISKSIINNINKFNSLEETDLKKYIDSNVENNLDMLELSINSQYHQLIDKLMIVNKILCGREELLDYYYYQGSLPIIDMISMLNNKLGDLEYRINNIIMNSNSDET